MSKAVDLAIRMTADAGDPVDAFDRVGSSAVAMGDDVERASRTAGDSVSRLDTVADSADNMGSSASQAAGGLGDLGGALSLMPGPLGAVGAGMESVAPAIMGVTGAMDLANLALKANVIQNGRARVAAIATAVTSRVVTVATKAWAAGQWLLNAALLANPVGAVILGIVALVAALVLAYKKSETFRNIVQGAMRGVQAAVGWVIDKVDGLIGFVKDLPGVWDDAKEGVVNAAKWMKDKVVDYFDLMTTPIRTVIGLVEDLIGWIDKIDFPDIPNIPGFGRTATLPGVGGVASSSTAPTVVEFHLHLEAGFIGDENTLATAIAGILARYFTRLGIAVPSWPQAIGVPV